MESIFSPTPTTADAIAHVTPSLSSSNGSGTRLEIGMRSASGDRHTVFLGQVAPVTMR